MSFSEALQRAFPNNSPARGWYITGTDTGIGKTTVACSLLRAAARLGLRAQGMKPIASGCIDGKNDDALALQQASASEAPYDLVNPYALDTPIAPHLAAMQQGIRVDLAKIKDAYNELRKRADCLIVEGAGGWLAPASDQLYQSDVVAALDLDVVLVVGMRLGCINHALLTARALAADGARVVGWIANLIDPDMLELDGNLQTLQQRLSIPYLGIQPFARPDAILSVNASEADLRNS